MKSIDELAANLNFTTAKTGEDRSVTFLPEPQRAKRRYTVISVDDHIIEPPDTFAGRLPRKFADRAPKVVDTDYGGQTWVYDGRDLPNVGFNAVVGRPVSEYGFEPVRFDEMHKGAWDIGSSGSSPATTEDAPPDVKGVLFFAYAISAVVDWLYSGLPSRFPDLKICLSEGIGWVAGLLDRLDHMLSYHAMYGTWQVLGESLTPAEVFTRSV
jgi:hypothetical protein